MGVRAAVISHIGTTLEIAIFVKCKSLHIIAIAARFSSYARMSESFGVGILERGKQNACTGAGRGARKTPALKSGL
jgi:hypothetical protein